MKKINFASRVMVPRTTTQTSNFNPERLKVQEEINAPSSKVNIDRSVFVKTEEEKQELKIEKAHWKMSQKAS